MFDRLKELVKPSPDRPTLEWGKLNLCELKQSVKDHQGDWRKILVDPRICPYVIAYVRVGGDVKGFVEWARKQVGVKYL